MPPLEIKDLHDLQDFIGRELGVSDWRSITQSQIQQFADTTGDHQWIHLDTQRAQRESPFRATIAHGFLTLSLISSLMKEATQIHGPSMVVNYGLNRVRFPAAVRVDSKVRARFKVLAAKETADAVEATFLVTVECDSAEKPCCVAEWVLRYYV